ncbi:MAG: hypothetical protein ACTS73_00455 [Arsenophonus sp. NEOnobi-MAG3]
MNKKFLSMLILASIITAVTGCDESPKVDDAIQHTKESAEEIKQAGKEKAKQVLNDAEEAEEAEEVEEADKLSTKADQLKETTKQKTSELQQNISDKSTETTNQAKEKGSQVKEGFTSEVQTLSDKAVDKEDIRNKANALSESDKEKAATMQQNSQ